MKRVSMELGGKSPNIVFEDADLDNAIKGVISGIFAATGQTCIAGSRLLVQQSIHDQFLEKLVAFAKTARMGDPMSADTQIGPVTNKPQLEKILKYIDIAKGEGARAVLGGGRASRPECGNGWFVEPTIFDGVRNSMRIAQEEVFGPGPRRDSVQGRRGGDRDRQRRRLRPGGRRVDAEHAPGADDGGEAPGGDGLDQHLSRGQLSVAVRRLQAIGAWPRERSGDDQGIPAGEERLDLDGDGRSESVYSALTTPRATEALSHGVAILHGEKMAGQLVGFVGVGRMGGPMASRLLDAGHSLLRVRHERRGDQAARRTRRDRRRVGGGRGVEGRSGLPQPADAAGRAGGSLGDKGILQGLAGEDADRSVDDRPERGQGRGDARRGSAASPGSIRRSAAA